MSNSDPVNHPAHYTSGKIETISIIEDQGILEPFCVGNILKYITRYRHKNGVDDLRKARWYLDKLISHLEHGA
jgi:hypothetical protein